MLNFLCLDSLESFITFARIDDHVNSLDSRLLDSLDSPNRLDSFDSLDSLVNLCWLVVYVGLDLFY